MKLKVKGTSKTSIIGTEMNKSFYYKFSLAHTDSKFLFFVAYDLT